MWWIKNNWALPWTESDVVDISGNNFLVNGAENLVFWLMWMLDDIYDLLSLYFTWQKQYESQLKDKYPNWKSLIDPDGAEKVCIPLNCTLIFTSQKKCIINGVVGLPHQWGCTVCINQMRHDHKIFKPRFMYEFILLAKQFFVSSWLHCGFHALAPKISNTWVHLLLRFCESHCLPSSKTNSWS